MRKISFEYIGYDVHNREHRGWSVAEIPVNVKLNFDLLDTVLQSVADKIQVFVYMKITKVVLL